MPPYDYRNSRRGVTLAQIPNSGAKADLPSPLQLARTSTDVVAAEAPVQGVGVALPPVPPASADVGPGVVGNGGTNVRSAYDRFYGDQLGALESGLQSMPQRMQDYRDQRNANIDSEAQITRDYINGLQPERSQWIGRFGAALLAPSKTGSFFESYGNAVNAALDAKDYESKQRAALEEKKYRARLGLSNLMANKIADPMDEMRDQFTLLETGEKVSGLGADYRLRSQIGNGTTPETPEGIIEAYRKNPSMFAGPTGRQMVADARDKLSASVKTADERAFELEKLQEQSRLKMLEDRNRLTLEGNKPTPLDRAEANRVAKRLAEVQTSAGEASQIKSDIAALQAARGNSNLEGMWFGDTYASLGQMVGAPGASELATVRSNAENLRVALSQKLKGAISDSDMKILGLATPGIAMGDDAANNVLAAQAAAAQRGIERSQFLQAWVRANGHDYGADEAWSVYTEQNPLFSESKDGSLKLNKLNVGNWRSYVVGPDGQPAAGSPATGANRPPQSGGAGGAGAGGAGGSQPQGLLVDPNSLPPKVKAWAEQQLRNGIPPEQVIERINQHILNKSGGQ